MNAVSKGEIECLCIKSVKSKFSRLINKKGFKTRQDIAFSGDYLNLIEDMSYDNTKLELKIGQNKYHQKNNKWHYFTKTILCNRKIYTINLDILEKNKKYYIYSINAKEVESLAKCQRLVSTSSINIISNHVTDLQKNLEIPVDWIDDYTLKLEIKDSVNQLSTIAVCKTLKKSMEFYITDGQQVESIKEKDLDAQLLHQFYEKVEEITGLQKDQFQEGMQR